MIKKKVSAFLPCLLLMAFGTIANPVFAQAMKRLYLPIIMKGGDPFEGIPKIITGNCKGFSQFEVEVMKKIATHPEQKRAKMSCDPILKEFAFRKAKDLATRSYFSHTDPDGFGPNYWVRAAGYPLPSFYGKDPSSNNIESLGGGYANATAVFSGWMNSPSHKTHVLGLIDFYAQQVDFGIGYYYDANSVFKHYWVFVSAYKE